MAALCKSKIGESWLYRVYGTPTGTNTEFPVGALIIDLNTGAIYNCVTNNGTSTTFTRIDEPNVVVSAAAAPAVTDDDYSVGTLWIKQDTDSFYFLTDNTQGAAAWVQVDSPHIYTSTSAPATTDDVQGVGAIWVKTNTDDIYVCADATNDAAVWRKLGPVVSSASAPATTDDTYGVGAIWVNTTTDRVYICADTTDNAAVWKLLDLDLNANRAQLYRCSTPAGLAIGTASKAKVKIVNTTAFINAGAFKSKTTAEVTLSGTALAAEEKCYILICLASDGTPSATQGTIVAAAGTAVLPAVPAGETPIGKVLVETAALTTFTFGTTELDAAGVTATYTDLAWVDSGTNALSIS